LHKQSNRGIARQFGLDDEAVRRHRAHIPQLLIQAANHEEIYGVEQILGRVEDLQRKTIDILERSEEEDDDRALRAIREARANLELIAKVRQLISDAPQVNFVFSPEWVSLRTVIVQALEPYDEAKAAVVCALAEAENGSH
jgi:hypothetical protein